MTIDLHLGRNVTSADSIGYARGKDAAEELLAKGIDYSAQLKAGFHGIQALRQLRGNLLYRIGAYHDPDGSKTAEFLTSNSRTFASADKFRRSYKDTDFSKHQTHINAICVTAKEIATKAGELFWNPKLTFDSPEYNGFIAYLNQALSNSQCNVNPHAKFQNAEIISEWGFYIGKTHREGFSQSDNLGKQVLFGEEGPSYFLDGISIKQLRGEGKIILAAAASGGLVEGGIIAHYMNNVLGIETDVDPIFLSKDMPVAFMSSKEPEGLPAVIPYDDSSIGSGYSAAMIMKGVLDKYSPSLIIANDKMQEAEHKIEKYEAI